MENDTKLGLLMRSLTEFFKEPTYIEQMQKIVDQNSDISLRVLDWFVTNYSKKYNIMLIRNGKPFDVYHNYKLLLKSYSKKLLDPFCRKNKIIFYYTDDDYIETSCGQLCFFRWCFQNQILEHVRAHIEIIEEDMKDCLRKNKLAKTEHTKRKHLINNQQKYVIKYNVPYTISF